MIKFLKEILEEKKKKANFKNKIQTESFAESLVDFVCRLICL
jgi:hypothetical protein